MGKERNKPRVEDVLAENYKLLKQQKIDAGTWRGIPGINPKTANNVENARHNTKLTTLVFIAEEFGLEPFQLLTPVKDTKFLAVMAAWAQTDDDGRDNLQAIAEAMLRRRKDNVASKSNPPPADRKRGRAG